MHHLLTSSVLALLVALPPMSTFVPQDGESRGLGSSPSAPAPEPITASLIGLGGVGLIYALRRRRDDEPDADGGE